MTDMAEAATRLAELEADNSRLRRLLDQRDAPGELRHRLRNTLAVLRMIIRKSAETDRDRDAYVAQLEDRLDALARVQASIDAREWVDLHILLANELLFYGASERDRVTLRGPAIELAPWAAQVFAMAFHELAVNAVEHGSLGTNAGRVEITWSVNKDLASASLTLTWKEGGGSSITEPARRGFGTEVLTKTIGYELKSNSSFTFEPDGLRYTVTIPLPEHVGRVVEADILPDGSGP